MRLCLLATLISTLGFSIGLVKAGAGASSEDDKNPRFSPVYDAMGIVSNSIVCNKNVYNKREAYAAVNEAFRLVRDKKYVVAGCESLKFCTRYPKTFTDRMLGFKLKGPYMAFPILPNKQLYKGGRLPVRDLVIIDPGWEVAGIVHANARGYSKCLLDDNYTPRSRNIFQRLKYKYHYWTGTK